jgi:hypothetical protein
MFKVLRKGNKFIIFEYIPEPKAEPIYFYKPSVGGLDVMYEQIGSTMRGINLKGEGKIRITVEIVGDKNA